MEDANLHRLRDMGWQASSDETFVGHIGSVYTRASGQGGAEYGILTQAIHQNLSGAVHGGVMMAMFDRVMGVHVRHLRPDERFATASMTVEFLRPVRVGDFVRLTSTITKAGRKAIFARGDAFVRDRLVAGASGVFMNSG